MQKQFLKDWEKNMDINSYEIILTDIAKEELEGIYEYIYTDLKASKAANDLMNKIEDKVLLLEKNPFICPEICIKPQNELYRKLIIDNYVVLYQVEEKCNQIIIYRALYNKRDYMNFE